MAWSNPGGTYNAQDMDSSDGTSAQKLCVRNAAAPAPDGNWRAEIKETGASAQALKVDGKLRFERGGNYGGTIEPFDSGAPSLDINTSAGDPDLNLGNTSHALRLNGSTVNMGAAPAPYRVGVQGTVRILGNDATLRDLSVQGDMEVEQRIWTPRVESLTTNGVLNVGTEQASQVLIGRPTGNNFTSVGSLLFVQRQAEFVDDVIVGADLSVAGDIESTSGSLIGPALDINGNGDVSGTLNVHGAVELSSILTVLGKTKHSETVNMNGFAIILGGAGGTTETKILHANGRIEFWVSGALRYYIDTTGGHNA